MEADCAFFPHAVTRVLVALLNERSEQDQRATPPLCTLRLLKEN